MNKLILGRYFPGDSSIHRLDPRGKLIAAIAFIFIVFLADGWAGYAVLWLFTFSAMLLSEVPVRTYIRGVRPLIWLILFTVVLQLLFRTGGTIYVDWGPVSISSNGILYGIYIFFHFTIIIFVTTVLTLTTKPVDLADGINFLLRPLKRLGIPVGDVGLMMTISLRFIPNLLDETQKVMDAQRARGTTFGEGNLLQQMKNILPLFLPLYAGSLNRAEELANVMEVRGYQSEHQRTNYRQLSWQIRDTSLILVMVLLTALLLLMQ